MSLDLSDISSDSEADDTVEIVPANTYKLALEEVSYNRDVNAIHIPLQRQKQLVLVDNDRRRKKGKEKKAQNRRRKGGGTNEAIPLANDSRDKRTHAGNRSANVKILSNKDASGRCFYGNSGGDIVDAVDNRNEYIDPYFNSTNITETSSNVFKLNVNAQEFIPKFTSFTNK